MGKGKIQKSPFKGKTRSSTQLQNSKPIQKISKKTKVPQTKKQQVPLQQLPPNFNKQTRTYDEQTAIQLEDKTVEQKNSTRKQKRIDLDAKMSEITERIKLNIIPNQDSVNVSSNSLMPVIIQYQVEKFNLQEKAGIDIVFVVDVSGSMVGGKISLVKDSLRYIQKMLNQQDRISIVTFSTEAEINLPWTRNTQENKKKIKEAIIKMDIRNSTNIASGVALGLRMIKNRKYKNPVTCMFVLTDGQDDNKGAEKRVTAALNLFNTKDSFIINTFGYGSDHDAKVMDSIASLKGGSFTFIEDIQKASEHFILSMSGLLSVFAKNVKLQLEENPNYKIAKLFGDDFLWSKNQKGVYEMNVNYLLGGKSKEFALLLEIPKTKKLKQANVLKAIMVGEVIEFEQEFQVNSELNLKFQQKVVIEEPKQIVMVNYLRAKAGDVIGEAKTLASAALYQEARAVLEKMIQEIEDSQYKTAVQLVAVFQDLQEAKQVCAPSVYQQMGEGLLLNKRRNHIQKQKQLCLPIEWDGVEEQEMSNFRNGKYELSEVEDEDQDEVDDEVEDD